jgi:hypothetical protein
VPTLLLPAPNRRLAALDGATVGPLRVPPEAPEQPTDIRGGVPHANVARDDLGHPRERPECGGYPLVSAPLLEQADELRARFVASRAGDLPRRLVRSEDSPPLASGRAQRLTDWRLTARRLASPLRRGNPAFRQPRGAKSHCSRVVRSRLAPIPFSQLVTVPTHLKEENGKTSCTAGKYD